MPRRSSTVSRSPATVTITSKALRPKPVSSRPSRGTRAVRLVSRRDEPLDTAGDRGAATVNLPLLTPAAGAREKSRPPATTAPLPLWREAFAWYDWWLLRTSTVFFGVGVPHGDGSAVVTIPGFLATDLYLRDFRGWLSRIGYRPYHSSIGRNAECPNVILNRLLRTVQTAHAETGRRVHLIGHSLGGVLARSAGAQRPDLIASVTVLGSPFRGIRSHPVVHRTHELVRRIVLGRESAQFLPQACYTGDCTCSFVEALDGFPAEVAELAVYTKADGIVDWRVCVTGDASKDREVLGTHTGLAFNPFVYRHVAEFLASLRSV